MNDAVIIAVVGFAGTVTTTIGVMLVKRRFDLADKRAAEREETSERCERLERIWPKVLFWARARQMQIIALAALCDSKPDYVLTRLREIAAEPNEIAEWDKYVEGQNPNP